MSPPDFLTTANASRIAYRQLDVADGGNKGADGPGIVFLIGHGSDMDGTKALACEDWTPSSVIPRTNARHQAQNLLSVGKHGTGNAPCQAFEGKPVH